MRKARLSPATIKQLIEHCVAGTPAQTSSELCHINRNTALTWYHQFRVIIYEHLQASTVVFDRAVEVDESYCGGKRKGNRERRAKGKKAVFGIYKRNGYVHAISVCNTKGYTLYSIIHETVMPDSIVYTDTYSSYTILDTSHFHHERINHSKEFVRHNNHIKGIENFWS